MSNRIEGSVSSIDATGKLITDIATDQLAGVPRDETVSIRFAGHETFGLYPVPHEQPETTMVASLGSSGFLEIEIVGMDLAGMLGIATGSPVEVTWNE